MVLGNICCGQFGASGIRSDNRGDLAGAANGDVATCTTTVTVMSTQPDAPAIGHCPGPVTLYQGATYHLNPPTVSRGCGRSLGCDYNPSDIRWDIKATGGQDFVPGARYPSEQVGQRMVTYRPWDSYYQGVNQYCSQLITVVTSVQAGDGINGRVPVPLVCPADVVLPTDQGRKVASYTFPTPEYAPVDTAVTWTITVAEPPWNLYWPPNGGERPEKPGDTAALPLRHCIDSGCSAGGFHNPIVVTYTYLDEFGVTTACYQTITVIDPEDPVISNCPLDHTVEIPPNSAVFDHSLSDGLFEDFHGSAQDNSGWAYLKARCPTTGDEWPVEELRFGSFHGFIENPYSCALPTDDGAPMIHRVIWTLTDMYDNRAQCTQQITVIDVHPPQFSGASWTLQANTDPGEHYYTHFPEFPDWSDNNDLGLGGGPYGTETITYIQQRGNDNLGMVLGNRELTAGQAVELSGGPTNGDAASAHVIRYTAVDAAGNANSITEEIFVYDNENPVVTRCPSDLTLRTSPGEHGTSYVPGVANVADNSDVVHVELAQAVYYNPQEGGSSSNDISFTISPGDGVSTMDLSFDGTSREHVFLHEVTDHNLWSGQCYQTVQVVDTEPPAIQCPADIWTPTDFDAPFAIVALGNPPEEQEFPLGPGAPPLSTSRMITGVATDNSMSAGTTTSGMVFGPYLGPYLTMRIDVEELYIRPAGTGVDGRITHSIGAVPGLPFRGPQYATTVAGFHEFPLGRSVSGRYNGGTGVHLVRYTATDPSGNAADCVQTVTVYDSKCLGFVLVVFAPHVT